MNYTGGNVLFNAHNNGEHEHNKQFSKAIDSGVRRLAYTSIDNDNNGAWLEDAIELDAYVGANSKAIKKTVIAIFKELQAESGAIRNKKRWRSMVKSALVNLYVAYRQGVPLRYSRTSNDYSIGKRYNLLFFTFDKVKHTFDALLSNGYIYQKIGNYNKIDEFGYQTRAWATDKLIKLFTAWDKLERTVITRLEREEVIILKGKKIKSKGKKRKKRSKAQDYTDTEYTNKARLNLKRYNNFIKKQSLTIDVQDGADISFRNLESIHRNSIAGLVSINPLNNHKQVLDIQEYSNNNICNTTLNIQNIHYYTITHTVNDGHSDSNSMIFLDNNSNFANELTFNDNYVFHKDIRATAIGDVSYVVNTMYKDKADDKDVEKERRKQLDKLRKRLRQKRKLNDFGIGGFSLTIQYNLLHRVYNNLSFEEGGRFYGAYHISLGKNLRKHILINNEPTVELDYKALHIRMLYHMEHINYTDDPYNALCDENVPGERDIYKKLLLIAINAEDDKSLVSAFRDDARKEELDCDWSDEGIYANLDKFKQHHYKIAHYLCTGIGRKLQNMDSQIANAIMKRLTRMNIVCLPIHDSFVVAEQYKNTLWQAMEEEYEKVMGFMPLIEKVDK